MEATRRIPLRARGGSVRAWALVDAADYDWLNQWRWSLGPNGYVIRGTTGAGRRGGPRVRACYRMHREILGLKAGDPRQCDHLNGDPLDNRRTNLRIVTRAQQAQNRAANRGGTSRHRNVNWHRGRGKWQVQVMVSGVRYQLGYFDDEDEAGRVAAEFRAERMTHAVVRRGETMLQRVHPNR